MQDISMATERLHLSVMSKASAISPQITGRTLGLNCMEACSPTSGAAPNSSSNSECTSPKSLDMIKLNKSLSEKLSCLSAEEICNGPNSASCVGKLIYDLEQERRAEVQEAMIYRLHKLQENTVKRQSQDRQRQAILSRGREDRALLESQQIQRQLLEQQHRESQRVEKLAIEKQRREYERNQLIKQAEQRAEEDKKQKEEKDIQVKKIKQCVREFQEKYQKLRESVKSCLDQQALQASSLSTFQMVKSLEEALKQLVNQCMVGEISNLDNQTAAAIIQQLDNCAKVIQDSVKKINDECEEKLARDKITEEQALAKAATSPATPVTPVAAEPHLPIPQRVSVSEEPSGATEEKSSLGFLENCVDNNSLQMYITLKTFLDTYQNSLLGLSQNANCKDFLFNCKKAVNIPVNAISDRSGTHLHDKLKKLTFLLLGETVSISGINFSASAHPQGIAFCMDFLAMKLVSQGKTTVSSKPEAAFPIAAIIVSIWADFPMFGQLLLAHFYRACPYLVPLYMPQIEGQSDIEYYKSLGYHYDENGHVEKHDKFLKKMCGIMHLFAAIFVTKVRQSQKAAHPYGLAEAWRWIASFVNLDPRPDISASLLLTFLEVTGSTMAAAYGQQFKKLLHLICKEYFPKVKKIDSGGPVTRLEAFLQSILKKGTIPLPSGILSPNFW